MTYKLSQYSRRRTIRRLRDEKGGYWGVFETRGSMLCYISDVEKAQLDVEDSDDSRSLIAVAVCVPGFVVAAVVVIWKKCRKSIKVCDCCCTSLLCGSFISKTVTEITFVLDLFCHTIQDFSLAFLILLFGIFLSFVEV